ncbi:MAG: hypothetical protein KKD33_06415, partial [Verrucomicrobia bacterium]|nr:hypothetical protein [Verrucomicrobiota bacterium]
LTRELFKTRSELFRMFPPEDFSGKRISDSNFCCNHSGTRGWGLSSPRRFLLENASVPKARAVSTHHQLVLAFRLDIPAPF